MHIFTQSIAFLTTNSHRPSVVSFLTCLRYIFNSSVIPEILSNNEPELLQKIVTRYCKEASAWYRLFARSDTMQFSPTLIIPVNYRSGFMEEILLPLKKNMRYFSCTLQRCEIGHRDLCGDREGVLAFLADVRSLIHLEFQYCKVHINEFLSLFLASSCRNQLEQLTISHQYDDEEEDLPEGIEGCFQRLRFLEMSNVEHSVTLKLIKRCPNLRTLIISSSSWVSFDEIFDLVPKLTTLKVDDVDDEVSGLSTLCDKLPELTSLDLMSAYGEDSQLRNIDFLHEKPWIQKTLRVLKVQLTGEERNRRQADEHPKKYDCVKDCLSHFRNLTQLHLLNFGVQLNDGNFCHLVHLGSLRQFRIFRAEVTSKGLFELALLAGVDTNKSTFFTNLQNLEIAYCKLGGTKKSPRHLLKFFSCCATNKLEVVKLRANDLSDADLIPELAAEWKRCGVKTLSLIHNTDLSDINDSDREKKNGLVNLSQLTSITYLNLRGLKNLRGLDFLANLQLLRELDASFIRNLKSNAIKVFSPHHNTQNSFLQLRNINLECSCEFNVPADEVLELLLENENIKLRLQELNLAGMSFSGSFHTLKKQFKRFELSDSRVHILKPPSD